MGTARRQYMDEFKREALELLVSSGRPLSVSIGTDGTLSYVYANGKTVPAYSIPLGNVISPDNLTNITGDVFQVSSESGSLVIGTAGTGALGTIQSSELESSTVDLATQLTNMVATQSAYGASSLVA